MVQGSDTDVFCLLEPLVEGLVFLMVSDFGFWHGYYSYYNTLSLSCCPTKFLIFTDLMSLQPPMSILGVSNLDSILKSRDITLPTKVHLVKAMVFPVVRYGCELDCEES